MRRRKKTSSSLPHLADLLDQVALGMVAPIVLNQLGLFWDQVGRWAPYWGDMGSPYKWRKYMAIWGEATLLIGGLNGILRGGVA